MEIAFGCMWKDLLMQQVWVEGKKGVKDTDLNKELIRHVAQSLAQRKCLVTGVATMAGYQSE